MRVCLALKFHLLLGCALLGRERVDIDAKDRDARERIGHEGRGGHIGRRVRHDEMKGLLLFRRIINRKHDARPHDGTI